MSGSGYELPQASVMRIVKAALPDNISVQKEVRNSLSKSAGLFLLYVTQSANEHCTAAKRSTISADDVLFALNDLQFDELSKPLAAFFQAYKNGDVAASSRAKPSKKEEKDKKGKDKGTPTKEKKEKKEKKESKKENKKEKKSETPSKSREKKKETMTPTAAASSSKKSVEPKQSKNKINENENEREREKDASPKKKQKSESQSQTASAPSTPLKENNGDDAPAQSQSNAMDTKNDLPREVSTNVYSKIAPAEAKDGASEDAPMAMVD